jgi:hypothetical protein
MLGKKKTVHLIGELKTAATSSDAATFAKLLVAVLTEDDPFEWIGILRVQRIVERFRNTESIKQLKARLSTKDVQKVLGPAIFKLLVEHLSICEYMQEVFDEIDKRTQLSSAASCSRAQFFRGVLRMVEIGFWAFNGRSLQDVMRHPKKPPTPQKLEYWERRVRDLLDVNLIILNSRIAKASSSSRPEITDPELNDLLKIGYLYEELRQSFDLYSYGHGTAHINRKSIVFKYSDQQAEIAAAVSGERIHDKDQTRQITLMKFEVRFREKLQFQAQWSFADFLGNNSGAVDSARAYLRARAIDLNFEIQDYLEVGTEINTKLGTFSIQELSRTWAFLCCIAIAGQEWNSRKREQDFKRAPIIEISHAIVAKMLSNEFAITHQRARALLRQFTTHLSDERIDLFYRPLVRIDQKSLLFPTPYILGARFERNVLVLAVVESDFDQKKKGFIPIRTLKNSFLEAGFSSLNDYRVVVNGNTLTDIDIIAYKNGVLFLGQAKILIEPDSMYDTWKAEQKLNHAAVQLRTCVEHIEETKHDLLQKLRMEGATIKKMVPFIITSTRQFTERQFLGYPVVDIGYIEFVLGGATETLIDPQNDRPRISGGRSYINGKYPTEVELENLVNETFHHVQARGFVHKHTMRKIGDKKLHLPMMRLRTAGESRMIFLD